MYKTNHICGIYLITNKSNGKMYVGQSEDVERRIKYHKLHLSQGKVKSSGKDPVTGEKLHWTYVV